MCHLSTLLCKRQYKIQKPAVAVWIAPKALYCPGRFFVTDCFSLFGRPCTAAAFYRRMPLIPPDLQKGGSGPSGALSADSSPVYAWCLSVR